MGKFVIKEWSGLSLSLKGRSHELSGMPCQDSSKFSSENGVYYGILSDGAGSAKNSDVGSLTVVNVLSKYVSSYFEKIYNEESVENVRTEISNLIKSEIQKVADAERNKIEDYAATAMFVAIKNDHFIIMHLGDGLISYSKNGEIKVASAPTNGEFINSTIFITSKNIENKINLIKGKLDSIDGFILMSDGTAESFYQRESKVIAPILNTLLHKSLISSKQQYTKILKQSFENTVLRNTKDDCSIVMMCRETDNFPNINSIENHKKYDLFKINTKFNRKKKRLNRLLYIWDFLEKDRNLDEISSNIGLPEKYTKKHLNHLLNLGFISKDKNKMYSRK